MKRYYFIVLFLITAFSTTFSQQWVETYIYTNPTIKNGEDKAYAMTVDRNGNIYQAGFVTSSVTTKHIILIKYNPSGVILWVRTPNLGNTQDKAYAITVDDLDNVYITGYTKDVSSYAVNMLLLKYSGSGDSLWARFFNGNGNGEDKAYAIQIDESDNIYIAGSSAGVNSGLDYILVKYNPSGTRLWDARYNGNGNDEDVITSMTIDSNGDPIVSGYSRNNHDEGSEDIVTIKYNKTNGSVKWLDRYNGSTDPGYPNLPDKAYAITVDRFDNIYVAGYTTASISHGTDAVAIAYAPNGDRTWVTSYNYDAANNDDFAYCIAATRDNNILISGSSKRGPQPGSEDFITIDIHSHNGNIKWIDRYNGAGNASDVVTCMALSNSDNEVYVSGYSQYAMLSTRFDVVTLKYKIANGVVLDSSRFNYSGADDIRPTCIVVDANENVIVGGNTVPSSAVRINTLNFIDNSDILAIGYMGGRLSGGIISNSVKKTDEKNSKLYQNFPNPFNPVTLIKFYLPNSSSVKLTVYDMLGRTVSTLADGTLEAGEHDAQFDGSSLSSGIYFYELNVNGVKDIKKMILTK